MAKYIELDGKKIKYELIYKPVKNLHLHIKPDLSIWVSANRRVPLERIEKFIKANEKFIFSSLAKYTEYLKESPQAINYVTGEQIKLFGKIKTFMVKQGAKNGASLCGDYIVLTVKDINDLEQRKKVVIKLFEEQCKNTILGLCKSAYERFKIYNIEFPKIRFRYMKSMWGNCQPKRNLLTFNYNLVKAPLPCIEYVVVHEFTHFLYANHSKLFYNQLAAIMPDWKARQTELNKYIVYTN